MSNAEDITNLFRRFGGDAGTYREIVEHSQIDAALQSWPLLGQIHPNTHPEAPPAVPGAVATAVRQIQPDEPVRARVAAPMPPTVSPSPVVTTPVPAGQPIKPVAENAAQHAMVSANLPRPGVDESLGVLPHVDRMPCLNDSPTKPEPAAVEAPVALATSAALHSPPVTPGLPRNDLQKMFDRMAHVAQVAEGVQASSPLKRLIKW